MNRRHAKKLLISSVLESEPRLRPGHSPTLVTGFHSTRTARLVLGTTAGGVETLPFPATSRQAGESEQIRSRSRDRPQAGMGARRPRSPDRGVAAGVRPIIRDMTNRRVDATARLDDLVETAKGFAHPARLRILAMLAEGELCVCQLTAVLELAPSTVSQHLSVLSRGGLVADRKDGKLVFYRLRKDGAAARCCRRCSASRPPAPLRRRIARVVTRLRRIPITTLCAAELDLEAVGVRQPAVPPPGHRGRDARPALPLRRQLGAQPDGRGHRPRARRRPA